jgi:hypothetical protein
VLCSLQQREESKHGRKEESRAEEVMPNTGRPRKLIDPDQVRNLAQIGCTELEMTTVLKCSERTLRRRFGRLIKEGRERMKVSLRRRQYEVAMRGNATMLIWLGKQYLGQRDHHGLTGPDGSPIELSYGAGLTLEQLDREIAKLLPEVQGVAEILGETAAAARIQLFSADSPHTSRYLATRP